jgi:hypothetical protein
MGGRGIIVRSLGVVKGGQHKKIVIFVSIEK